MASVSRAYRRSPAWVRFACLGALGIAVYFLLPSRTWQNVGYVVSNLVGLAARGGA